MNAANLSIPNARYSCFIYPHLILLTQCGANSARPIHLARISRLNSHPWLALFLVQGIRCSSKPPLSLMLLLNVTLKGHTFNRQHSNAEKSVMISMSRQSRTYLIFPGHYPQDQSTLCDYRFFDWCPLMVGLTASCKYTTSRSNKYESYFK